MKVVFRLRERSEAIQSKRLQLQKTKTKELDCFGKKPPRKDERAARFVHRGEYIRFVQHKLRSWGLLRYGEKNWLRHKQGAAERSEACEVA